LSRITVVAFRLGTVLISISLALFLVSLIPSGESTPSTNEGLASPQSWQPYYSGVLSPQLGIRISVNANQTYKLYILQVQSLEIYNWIAENFQKANLPPAFNSDNLTLFEQYLAANPTAITRQDQKQGGGTIQYDYIPTRVVNATIVATNPNEQYMQLTFTWNSLRPFGPASITLLAETTLIIGLVLIMPHMAKTLTTKKHKNATDKRALDSTHHNPLLS
jgi:hypothetical protein